MHFGVDYYPEHWDAELMAEDIARIGAMGADMVRIGEFAWHLMEPTEGAYDFTFFDGVLEELREGGLVAMFGTPTATFPAWLAAAHPEILGAGPDGLPRVFGGRRQYCYNSPVYRDYCTRIVTALVSHYADERTIVSWQIDNEFGHEGSDDCYCANCQVAWRDWLAAKYDGIDDLNRRWGTIFWGQTYNGFDEVPCPLPTITTHSPSLKLDWARFRSDSLNDFARSQIALVRSLKGPHQSVTTNLCGGFFGKLFDHRTNVADLDFVSYDNYPVWGGLVEPMEPAEIAMTLDFVRGLRRANFWIVEQLMGAQGHDVIGYLPRPKQAQMWAYQAFGHGCESMLWFRWRGMTRGAEQYCL
ncbi:MAG: beta-galactosidase, partial [Actinomycetota bacterium]|nr:beta-galactosidase [Actinomycetota bacterium]